MMSDDRTPDGAPSQLFANLAQDRGVLTVRLVGPNLGEREGGVVKGMIEQRLAESPTPVRVVVLDFADISFMNSSGISACLVIQKLVASNAAKTVLYGLSDQIASILKSCKLDKIFTIAAGEKALAKAVR